MNRILCIVQARTSSSRLPGKVLLDFGRTTVLGHVINQLSYSQKLNKIVVATSNHFSDDLIEGFCIENNISCFRGDLNDVLSRYYFCALSYNSQIVVRITADCPLIDPEIVDKTIEQFESEGSDYVSNNNPPTYPDGLDVEVFTFSALKKSFDEAKLKYEREHVTQYILNNDFFKRSVLRNSNDLSQYRWTLDTSNDFAFLVELIKRADKIYPNYLYLNMEKILNLLDIDKSIMHINSDSQRNEGLAKSILNEKE